MRGFSLLEALVATSIVAVGVVAVAHLMLLAGYANGRARQTTVAAVLAQQKLEDLAPDAARDSTIASPADALDHNTDGYFEFVDRTGNVLGAGATPPDGSAFVRRWSLAPLPDTAPPIWLLQVLVRDLRDAGADAAATGRRLRGDARLVAKAGRTF